MTTRHTFISHSSADAQLAQELVDLLSMGVGIPKESIFCSSLPGHGIPAGEDFKAKIRNELARSEVALFLVSGSFSRSKFCMAELGAAWALDLRMVAAVLPPLGQNHLPDILHGLQGVALDAAGLDTLRDALGSASASSVSVAEWNNRKAQFLTRSTSLAASPVADAVLDRGDVREYVVDSVFHIPPEQRDIRRDILWHIQMKLVMPTTYSYLTEVGFRNWTNLCKDPDYNYFRRAVGLLSASAGEIVDAILGSLPRGVGELDFISLGPGDGQKDLALLRACASRISDIYYYPYDVNSDMLSSAVKLVTLDERLRTKLRVKAIMADFTALPVFRTVYCFRRAPNVFSLLGNTLGNMAHERDFLRSLYHAAMDPGDILLLEVKKVTEHSDSGPDGDRNLNKRFDFGPLEIVGVDFEPDLLRYKLETGRGTVPSTRTTVASYGLFRLHGRFFDGATLAYIHEYQLASVVGVLREIGFAVVKTIDSDPECAVLIVRKS